MSKTDTTRRAFIIVYDESFRIEPAACWQWWKKKSIAV